MKVLTILKLFFYSIIDLAIAIPVILGMILKFSGRETTPPNATDAPWMIQTTSRIYYGKAFSLVNGVPELNGFWTLDGKNYDYHDGIIAFPSKLYGKFGQSVILVQRTASKQ